MTFPVARRLAAILAVWVCVMGVLVALPATVAPTSSAAAADAADWNPGNIIDDAVFYDGGAMTAGEIQTFLNGKVRTCQAGYTCLKDYRQSTDNRPADKYCNGYAGAPNESAATIIDKVARSCGISQKALLVGVELLRRHRPGMPRHGAVRRVHPGVLLPGLLRCAAVRGLPSQSHLVGVSVRAMEQHPLQPQRRMRHAARLHREPGHRRAVHLHAIRSESGRAEQSLRHR